MENYVLYDEIGRGSHSVVYKGRKRGTVEFVAIHCVEKYKRLELQNIVRLTHELHHENVVKFCEWYETTNHIWMVVELCTGDSLDAVLVQDKVLPEDTVRRFGTELAKGLFYIHSLGILYCDLRPSRIMTDGAGVLKLSDFGLARVEGEDEYYEFGESNSSSDEDAESYKGAESGNTKRPKASPYYLAPEVLEGGPHSKESDLWSLGCLLFELFTGEKPFVADSFPELVTKIFHEECPDLRQGTEEGCKSATDDLTDLVRRLLTKHPEQRLDWISMITHTFWGGSLDELLKHDQEIPERVDLLGDVCSEETSSVLNVDIGGTEHQPNGQSIDRARNAEDCDKNVKLTAPEQTGIKQGTYTFSSRPRTMDSLLNHSQSQNLGETQILEKGLWSSRNSVCNQTPSNMALPKDRNNVKDDMPDSRKSCNNLEKEGKTGTIKVLAVKGKSTYSRQKTVILKGRDSANTSQSLCGSHMAPSKSENDISDLIHHPSDFVVTPIADNPKIKKFSQAKWESKALPCQALKAEELLKLPEGKQEEHLHSVLTLLTQSAKTGRGSVAALQRSKLHTASYLVSLCRDGDIGNIIFESELIAGMLKQIKSGFSADFKARLAIALGLLAGNATLISENFDMTEVFTILTEVIRDNFRNARLKQHLLPALGEFLFYAATQEENERHQIPEWDVPGVTFTIITRCLHEGEDIVVQHFAAKTIENVASTHSRHMEKFATNDTAQLLWNLFTHCTVDTQKVTAISALSRLTRQAPVVFQHVIEKAGFKAVLTALSSGVTKVQQAALTMFATLLSTRPQARRLIQERDLIPKVMHLLESSSVVIRGKTFLMVQTMVQTSKGALLSCCQSRLVTFIERDMKRSAPVKGESPENHAYLMNCLHQCVSAIVNSTPGIVSSVLSSLGAVEGRRHPSAGQAKQLRTHLPLLSIILHLVTSHVFRPQILADKFLADLGAVLRHVKSIDAGSTCIGSAAGPNAAEDMTSVVLSTVEAITQHPALVLHRHAAMVEHILPSLASLVSSSSGDTRVLCFRMFSEMASLFLDDQNVYNSSSAADVVLGSTQKLDEVIRVHLLPQYHLILGDQDPLPAYGLKLLLSFMERSPEIIRTFLAQGLLGSLSQILQSHGGGLSTGMAQSMVGLLDCVTSGKDVEMTVLYEQGLIESVTSLFVHVASLLNEDGPESENSPALLLPLLDTVNNILKFVSREVRKALLAKNEGGVDSEFAEGLLVDTKPLAEITGVLINFLCHDDVDVQDGACKCLYLMAELYGGLHEEALSLENMECFAEALSSSDFKRQKQLLRVVKRLIASNAQHVNSVVNSGQVLLDVLQRMKDVSDNSNADSSAVQSLAQEVWVKLGLVT